MASAPRSHELSRSPLHNQREHDFWSSKCATLNSNSLQLGPRLARLAGFDSRADESGDLPELCMCGWSMTSDNVLMGLYLAKSL